ncbi:glycoprotein-N-acetylgalactosamine 3-beta-galactosyltransferase 1-like [Haliotis rubra]|uniref:glycoprotein-N-acetylgalactosamine 3-beta-galactosyltransferase 1-like n=1 Tax=Haliotis rubra TaxID=36100 RepID=UPI001EE5E7A3|nr:glycoprotein-N-acetylgalactosamine 3-beta-galactosyltransferase 1-like [Haliotis rubra]XP_046562847.1 glycoprotein-N-acetylgalactosamine 3-beta-galactosyltransferase 1-like [Haliotis rubra]XP_046562848.1 glycoprotein-N-acetylgalactosamine 3-beta-galactosyltransferase 1-like [Haliotis rubra]
MRNILMNDTVSQDLQKQVRILCLVPTTVKNEDSKVYAVNATWGSRCNKLLFVFTYHHSKYPHISLNISDGRSHLTAKTMQALKEAYKQYGDSYDWILKADDDSFIIMENLRFLLSKFDPNNPVYIGYHFKVLAHNGYMSGGGSYVLSKAALRMVVEKGFSGGCATDGGDEDVDVGRCMEKLGIKAYVSYDKFGRDAFHPQSMEQHLIGPLPWYLKDYPASPIQAGPECCSQFSISFHYVSSHMMYIINFLLYRVSVYGVSDLPADQLQDIFTKKISYIKHQSKDEVFPIHKYFGAPNFVPQEHPEYNHRWT